MNSSSRFSLRSLLTACLLLVLLTGPFAAGAAPISWTSPSIIKAGLGAIASTITNQAVKGSYIARGGNFVCDSVNNPNCGLVYGVQGFETPGYAKDTNSGSQVTYDTIRLLSPYSASTASSRGLKTGTGTMRWAQLRIISNPTNAPIDCTKVAAVNTATGGTVIFADVTGTGTTAFWNTGITVGPTEIIKCGTRGTITSSFSGTLLTAWTYSEVIN